jgi:transposase
VFVRKTKSRNSTCFQIGKKQHGRFVLMEHIGCANTFSEIEALKLKAQSELTRILFKNQLALFPEHRSISRAKLLSWRITGFHDVFGTVYDRIGFPATMLRDFVVARIVYPKSKLATTGYLSQYLGKQFSKDAIYRFLDTLNKHALTKVAFEFVSKRNNGISLIFYDVTTLSFETNTEDELRRKGYSKEHRNDMPQVLIGLFVDHDGYPFDFDIFEGNKFEGHTFKTAVANLIKKYSFKNLTIVADAGMLSEDNLLYLREKQIQYIVGARIKNLSDSLKENICMHDYTKDNRYELALDQQLLIVDYSPDRARKDRMNREKLVRKLEVRIAKGEAVIHKSKYVMVENTGKVTGIDSSKIEEEKQFDGLKGYVTTMKNTVSEEIIKQYHNLWRVEKAFRMSKSDLRERPVYRHHIPKVDLNFNNLYGNFLLFRKLTNSSVAVSMFSINLLWETSFRPSFQTYS